MRFPELKPSRKFMCNVGADQTFNEVLFEPHQFDPQKMHYNGGFWFPVIIEMSTQDPSSGFRDQSQITMCVVERSTQSMVLKPVKQKLIMDGIVYLMQDIFGIENREANSERDFECSICKDNESDTVLLPCRHLCICKNCDDSFLHNVSLYKVSHDSLRLFLGFILSILQIACKGSTYIGCYSTSRHRQQHIKSRTNHVSFSKT
jgi:hypothetical protein